MAGHSKWKNIMHRKSKSDTKRAKIFTKIGREIMVAVKQNGADINTNSKLYDIVTKAKANNMPNENIKRSIDKAAGNTDAAEYEENTYEGYGPGGVAIIVETLTDNKNRTAGELRHIFSKFGGNLGTPGCVSFSFERKGVIIVLKDKSIEEDSLMLTVLNAGAEDFCEEDDYYEILTETSDFTSVCKALEEDNITPADAEIKWIPNTEITLENNDFVLLLEKLLDSLEDNDDVREVWHNCKNI